MIAIYSNNIITDICIQQLNFSHPHHVYHDMDEYIKSPANFKIAFVNHLNSYDPPVDRQQRMEQVVNGNKFCQEIVQLKSISNLLFAFDNEMHDYHFDIFQQNSEPNVYWVIPIHANVHFGINKQNLIFYPFQIGRSADPYQLLTHKLQQINHKAVKPRYFDALLGLEKPHRNFVHNAIEENHLQQKFLTTYTKDTARWLSQDNGEFDNEFKREFLHEPDIENFHEAITHSAMQVEYQGQTLALSVIVPIQIYNQTAYSIVAETHADNRHSFFTEKIFKPMLAHRLFVVFSGWKYLKNLRALGFQTFGNVIDESYDLIENNEQRWLAAFEQVKRLCKIDQAEVLEKISDQVQHNYNLIMDTRWGITHLLSIQQKINNEIGNF